MTHLERMQTVRLDASSLSTNILVTVLVLLMVFLLPYIDRKVCAYLEIDVRHKRTANTREAHLLRLREFVFQLLLILYFAVYVYLTFFSRQALEDYVIHVEPLQDLINSVHIDTGIVGVISTIIEEGLMNGLSKIQIKKPEDIAQFYMNVMLFVPMGYLLPYVFDSVQKNVHVRSVLICFLISFVTENLQLIFKVGFYDFDDIIANTLGGFIGQELYVLFAYNVERPDMKHNQEMTNRWHHQARKSVLYPMANDLSNSRAVIYASDPSVVWDFYIKSLGFMKVSEVPGAENSMPSYLLRIGEYDVEIICVDKSGIPAQQSLCIAADNLDKLKKRLKKCKVETGDFTEDAFTHLRKLTIIGPDNTDINFLE